MMYRPRHSRHSRHRRPRLGFTLLELLVVLFIISILAALVLSALTKVRITTMEKAAVSKLSQIRAGVNQYWILYNEGYPLHPDAAPPWINPQDPLEGRESPVTGESGVTAMTTALLIYMIVYDHPNYRQQDDRRIGFLPPNGPRPAPNEPTGNANLRRGSLFEPQSVDRFDDDVESDTYAALLDPWGNPYVTLIDEDRGRGQPPQVIIDVDGNSIPDPDDFWDVRDWEIGGRLEETAVVRDKISGMRIYQQLWLYSIGNDGESDEGYNAKRDDVSFLPTGVEFPYDDQRPY